MSGEVSVSILHIGLLLCLQGAGTGRGKVLAAAIYLTDCYERMMLP